ncbi:MAG: peptidase M48 [Alkalinema sp. CACIAM 70d]|nr:MAG: peptidase M48 [Alkalinema sp. CACIAM 70d]
MPIEIPSGTAAHSDRNPESNGFDLFKLAVLGIGFVIGTIWLISVIVHLIIWWIPPSVEQKLGAAIVPTYERMAEAGATQEKLNQLLDQLEAKLPADKRKDRNYQVLYIPQPIVNAAAIPGDRILIYKGLLNQTESENELVMVMGHELGHFTNRDHLRGLGNALLIQLAFTALTGDGGSLVSLGASSIAALSRAQFSQTQETQADEVGLQLLNAYYGQVAGAVDFFDRVSRKDRKQIDFLATHPAPKSRVDHLQQLIQQKGYKVGSKTPLPSDLRQ